MGLPKNSFTPNVFEKLHFRLSESPEIGRSQLARISNTGDVVIVPTSGALALVQNQFFKHVGYIICGIKPISLVRRDLLEECFATTSLVLLKYKDRGDRLWLGA